MARKKTETAEALVAEETAKLEQTVKANQAAILKGRVKGGSLNVRRCPKREAPIERVLADGEAIEILETVKEWYRISDGYVRAEYVTAE